MKEAIKNIFNIRENIWLFFFPIIAFYIIGKASANVIVINGIKGLLLFNLVWFLCSIGIYVIFRAIKYILIAILNKINNLLDKKRN